jgi:hypothetical protein
VAAALRDAARPVDAPGVDGPRIGLFLYDHLAKREWLPASGTVACAATPPARR